MRGLKSLNQLSGKSIMKQTSLPLWQMELIHLWSAFLFRKNYIWGLQQQILGEKPNDFLLNDKQSTSQSCFQTTELNASAGDSGSFTVLSLLLTCFRRSSKFTYPSSPCYFWENMNFVDSASYCSIYNSPAKSQLVVISLQSLFNNLKMLLSIHKLSLTSRDVRYR